MSNDFEKRVLLLEKRLRLYRFCFVVFMIAIAGLTIMSFTNKKAAPDVIQAKAFQVVDDNGNVLVDLKKAANNGEVNTYNSSGTKLVSLITTNGGAGGLNTFGQNGDLLFKLTNTIEGGGYMALYNGSGTPAGEMGVTNNETGYFNLNDRYGKKTVWMTYTTDGGGYLSLGKDGSETIRMSTPAIGGRVGIYNSAGTRIAYIGAQDNADGNITVWNSAAVRSGGIPQ